MHDDESSVKKNPHTHILFLVINIMPHQLKFICIVPEIFI